MEFTVRFLVAAGCACVSPPVTGEKMRNKIFHVIVTILLCFWVLHLPVFAAKASNDLPKNLIVANQDKIVKLIYDAPSQKYKKQTEFVFPGASRLAKTDKYIFAVSGNELVRLGMNLDKPVSKRFSRIDAVAAAGNCVFISADNSFMALDENLNKLSNVNIGKNAHDILIYKNEAYLLDNIMQPLYILKVDAKNPAKLQILKKEDFSGVNAHLDYQWLNPELNQWVVIQSYAHMGGSGQTARIYSTDNAKKEFTAQKICSETPVETAREENTWDTDINTSGNRILGVTALAPVFAVIYKPENAFQKIGEKSKKTEYSLCKVDTIGNKISFSDILYLDYKYGKRAEGKFIIKQSGNYLFIMPHDRTGLTVIDTAKQPKLILSQVIKELGLPAANDILAY